MTELTHGQQEEYTMSELLAQISEHPISAATVDAAVAGPKNGAVVVFAGTVRNHDGGQSVSALEYQLTSTPNGFYAPVARKFLQPSAWPSQQYTASDLSKSVTLHWLLPAEHRTVPKH